MRKCLLYITLLILFVGCEEEIPWQTNSETTGDIVVDCILTNEYKRQELKLSYITANLNEIYLPVSGANVRVSTSDTMYVFEETPLASGIYLSDSVQAVVGRDYYLYIEYNGNIYTAETQMVPVSSNISRVSYGKEDDTTEMYEVYSVANPIDEKEQAMWHVYIDWTDVAGYDTIPDEDKTAKLVYYTLTSVDPGQIFSPDKEKVLFPPGTKIRQEKYSLTPDYAEFIRTLLAETEWRGGYFDAQPDNVITNISGGAYGYFTASTVFSFEFLAY